MKIDPLYNLVVGGIIALGGVLMIMLAIYFASEWKKMQARHKEEERRNLEREAELKNHMHQKPEDRKP